MIGTIRVVLVEDHGLVRAGIHELLRGLAGVEVIGEASDGREAMALIGTTFPDVVLMDIAMPGLNGLQALARIGAEFPQVRVVILSMHDGEDYVWQALNAGAAGYVLKDAAPAELELAVRTVARGSSYLSPGISRQLTDVVRRGTAPPAGGSGRLTPRQAEIAQLVAEGNTNHEIALRLGISLKTVETHRALLMDRLGIHDVAGLVRYAVRTGLVTSDR